MSVSIRSLSVPAAALATAGVLALTPAVIPPAVPLAAPEVSMPTVHVDNIALAGIGRDLYNAVQPWVQYGVELAQYGVEWVPYIGPPLADQIGINYFNLVQPLIANTVYVLSDIFADPLNLPVWVNSYFVNQGQVLVNYGIVQAQFFGFPPLPPIPFPPVPPLAATRGEAGAGAPAAATGPSQRLAANAVAAPSVQTEATDAEAPAPVRASRSAAARPARDAGSATPRATAARTARGAAAQPRAVARPSAARAAASAAG